MSTGKADKKKGGQERISAALQLQHKFLSVSGTEIRLTKHRVSALTLLVGWQEGHPACKKVCGWWRWAMVSPDGLVPSRMVSVSASVNLPLHHKVQKFSSGTGCLLQYKPVYVINFDKLRRKRLKSRSLVVFLYSYSSAISGNHRHV